MTKLTVTSLKKELKQWEQQELIQLITDLYKISDDVKNYLSNQLIGEESVEELFQKTRKKIIDEFFPDRGFGKLRLGEAKKEISKFKKLTNDQVRTVELMIVFVEWGTEFTNTYGDIDSKFYNSLVSVFEKVCIECDKNEQMYHQFKERLERIVDEACDIGWGYGEAIGELYYSIEWTFEDEEE